MKSQLIRFWKDKASDRSAAENMALDEALFLSAVETDLVHARFYHWSSPAITFGYFQQGQTRGGIRRMTGGGVVEHGEDLTFTLAYPKDTTFAQATGTERYKWVHQALVGALESVDFHTELLAADEKADGPCFAAPVQWDITDPASGKKIAGGAQRRSRGAIIHQGSIRIPSALRSPNAKWIDQFLSTLAEQATQLTAPEIDHVTKSAQTLETNKYGSGEWNEW